MRGFRKHILSLVMPIFFLCMSVRTVCSCVSQKGHQLLVVTLCLWPSEVVFLSFSGLGWRVVFCTTVLYTCQVLLHFVISVPNAGTIARSFFCLLWSLPYLFIGAFTNRTQYALKFNLCFPMIIFLCLFYRVIQCASTMMILKV